MSATDKNSKYRMYDLKEMLEEIKEDEGAVEIKKNLDQNDIKKMIQRKKQSKPL